MADEKPTPIAKAKAEDQAGVADPSGTISNRADGEGTRQLEPRPEDYPAAAKVTPPAEQLNPALSQAVGAASVPAQVTTPAAGDIEASARKAEDSIQAAIDRTDARFVQKAEDEKADAKADAK